ncbi:hypothetical protein [Ralstonia syzygii]|uniref:hypothetical protein n=1 Tax=Ralstonia syzygii TaxID=28097 RepID=UPI0018D080D5|nr:hypothetical protein [Ralstonia syzygii]
MQRYLNCIGLWFCAALMIGLASTVAAETLALNSAINKAGKTGMPIAGQALAEQVSPMRGVGVYFGEGPFAGRSRSGCGTPRPRHGPGAGAGRRMHFRW